MFIFYNCEWATVKACKRFDCACSCKVHIAILQVRVLFGVVTKLYLDIGLKTAFIKFFVRGIFTSLRKVTFKHARPIYFISICREKTKKSNSAADHIWTLKKTMIHQKVRVAR